MAHIGREGPFYLQVARSVRYEAAFDAGFLGISAVRAPRDRDANCYSLRFPSLGYSLPLRQTSLFSNSRLFMRIFFSVGEPSGDLHGANLIRAMQAANPDVKCEGFGGPLMREAGCELHEELTRFAVMLFGDAVRNLRRFWGCYQRARQHFRDHKPDAVVLIDYPGFNWWIASAAKEHGVPVFYYGAPQLWAWASWRVRKMRRLVDHVLCKLPFEETWYRERGCNAHFIGHPYFDELQSRQLDQPFVEEVSSGSGPLISILPGSRRVEVRNNLPGFLKAAERIRASHPNTRFAIASFNDEQGEMAREICRQEDVRVDVHVGRTPELIEAAHSCLACSGSVSLELLYHCKPAVIHYRVSPTVYLLGRALLTVRYVTLVNLLASEDRFTARPRPYDPDNSSDQQVPYPEYPTSGDKSAEMASHIAEWLDDPEEHARRVRKLSQLRETLVRAGASQQAASYILNTLDTNASRRAA